MPNTSLIFISTASPGISRRRYSIAQDPRYVFIQPVSLLKCRGGGECEFVDDVHLKIKTATHPDAKALDEVLLWVPIVEGVFDAFCECTFVGLN